MYYRFASKFVSKVEGGSRKRFLLYFRSFVLLFLGLQMQEKNRNFPSGRFQEGGGRLIFKDTLGVSNMLYTN